MTTGCRHEGSGDPSSDWALEQVVNGLRSSVVQEGLHGPDDRLDQLERFVTAGRSEPISKRREAHAAGKQTPKAIVETGRSFDAPVREVVNEE